MAHTRQGKTARHLVLSLFTALIALGALSACGGGHEARPTIPLPPGGNTVPVHFFEYDPSSATYIVNGERVTQDDVDRDLAGSLCIKCHGDAVAEVKDSVHFKLTGRTPRVLFPGGGAHGMLDRACGLPATTGLTNSTSNIGLGECAKCHVGRYLPVMEGFFASMFQQMGVADPQGQATQLIDGGIDCLVCHAEEYKSHPTEGVLADIAGTATPDAHSPTLVGVARDSRDNADFNHDGQPDLVIDTDGDGVLDAPLMVDTTGDGQPDTPWPTVAQDRSLDALSSITNPDEHACLRCHEHARTGYKRGTLFLEGHDVHAALDTGPFAGTTNQCTTCHTVDDHKYVRGHMVGGDLAAADYTPPPPGTAPDPNDPTDLTCQTCHDVADLQQANALIHSDRHLETFSCQACHITWASGITYSLFGHGGHVSFARNEDGRDTKLVVADMYIAEDRADIDADWEAFKTRPMLVWFNGGTSFLAQTLAVRGMPNAQVVPFKPMANGMVFDSRYFNGATVDNDVGPYNAHSMYRFFANGSNAEAFYALDMLDMTPDEVRAVTLADFGNPDPSVQTMALMQIFPNLAYFDKADFGFEHYLAKTGSEFDQNADGIIDAGQDFLFDMFMASNAGLRQFMGFNGPMGFPADYQWYPMYESVKDTISMKLPDGSLMKMFLQMQAQQLPPDQQEAFLQAVANYPAFSNVTLGGHGVQPKEQALGAAGCADCHGGNGVLAHKIPVGRKELVDMGPMGTFEFPVYAWRYYQVQELVDLGLATSSEDVLAGTNVDIHGDTTYVRDSKNTFVLNWFAPNDPSGYRPADAATALEGTGLTTDDLTWNGGKWMPVLEPVVDLMTNLEVLGYPATGIPMGN